MLGPFPLTEEELSNEKYDNNGVYFLGGENFWGSNKIKYVGRGHLRTEIKLGLKKYSFFYYRVFPSIEGRFTKECSEYHRYGKSNNLDNKIHPARPNLSYPKCTELGCNGEPT